MEDYKVCAAMIRFGGSFASAPGEAALAADEVNRLKIKNAFSDLWRDYTQLAEMKAGTEKASKGLELAEKGAR